MMMMMMSNIDNHNNLYTADNAKSNINIFIYISILWFFLKKSLFYSSWSRVKERKRKRERVRLPTEIIICTYIGKWIVNIFLGHIRCFSSISLLLSAVVVCIQFACIKSIYIIILLFYCKIVYCIGLAPWN